MLETRDKREVGGTKVRQNNPEMLQIPYFGEDKGRTG